VAREGQDRQDQQDLRASQVVLDLPVQQAALALRVKQDLRVSQAELDLLDQLVLRVLQVVQAAREAQDPQDQPDQPDPRVKQAAQDPLDQPDLKGTLDQRVQPVAQDLKEFKGVAV
jgi:hypothetical protein